MAKGDLNISESNESNQMKPCVHLFFLFNFKNIGHCFIQWLQEPQTGWLQELQTHPTSPDRKGGYWRTTGSILKASHDRKWSPARLQGSYQATRESQELSWLTLSRLRGPQGISVLLHWGICSILPLPSADWFVLLNSGVSAALYFWVVLAQWQCWLNSVIFNRPLCFPWSKFLRLLENSFFHRLKREGPVWFRCPLLVQSVVARVPVVLRATPVKDGGQGMWAVRQAWVGLLEA